ncbi:MAG TPA: phage holin family protein [Longimicrobiaceae bacterium]|nr:phage holin family protein [Longimicrobiaceae bacterium]
MIMGTNELRTVARHSRRLGSPLPQEPPIGDLFKQFSADAGKLVQQEIALAKAELKESGRAMAKDAIRIFVAVGLAFLGSLAAVAFLIIALGALLNSYWLSSLLVAAALLVTGAVLGKGAADQIKERDLTPERTVATLRRDSAWAKSEIESVKREWRS